MLICKGKCDNTPTRKAPVGGRLKEGQEIRRFYSTKPFSQDNNEKFCSICEKFLDDMNIRCFCCGAKLRTRARNNKSRTRDQEIIIKSIDSS
jgi:hypothetical protein